MSSVNRAAMVLLLFCAVASAQSSRRSRNPHGPLTVACEACHTATSWKPVRPHPEFNHNTQTAYPLRGMHEDVQCTACHLKPVFKTAPKDCASCHADLHRGQMGKNCEQCHTVKGWRAAAQQNREHANRFPLFGAHAMVQCESCHRNAAAGAFKGLSTECVACHRDSFAATKFPPHQAARFPLDCTACHSMNTWRGAKFDHAAIAHFALDGAHRTLDCQSCHIGGQFAGTPAACVNCHLPAYQSTTNPSHVAANFPKNCSNCHTTATWLGAKFDHAATGFQLTGAHTPLQCAQCHIGGKFAGTPAACVNCHLPAYQSASNPNHVTANFPKDCSACHTTTTWIGAKFNHAATGFALTGAHAPLQCSQCHTGTAFAGLSKSCDGCHMTNYKKATNPNHVQAGFPVDCSVCHTTVQWAGAKFDHAGVSGFPLTGAHAPLQCSQCHTGSDFKAASRTCDGCHMADYKKTTNPNHVQAGFPTDCSVCHTNIQWAGAKFDHAGVSGFPLTGAHAPLQCRQCHTGSDFKSAPRTCEGCHIADFKKTTNPNHVQAGFPSDCSLCHTTIQWAGAQFDHSRTKFALTGAHKPLQCAQCHTSGTFASTAANCDACHLTRYKATTNPNHVTAGFPLDCSVCHTTTSWAGAVFDHSKSKFPLTGAHVSVQCASCHVGGRFTGTPTDCYSCHKANYDSVQNPNHKAANYPTTCTSCHTTTTWKGATATHNKFPIYSGKHAKVWTSCADCHVNPSNYNTFSCINCHQHTQANTDSHHRGVRNYAYQPTTCYQCHPTGNKG